MTFGCARSRWGTTLRAFAYVHTAPRQLCSCGNKTGEPSVFIQDPKMGQSFEDRLGGVVRYTYRRSQR